MDYRGVDTDLGWVNRELTRLRREIESLRSERRAASTTIGNGNLVIDGGDVTMLDVDGSVMFLLGGQLNGDRGVTISRESGVAAFAIRKSFPTSNKQTVVITDANGLPLVAEESLGNGLSHPFLPIPLQPATATSSSLSTGPWGYEITSSSTTYETTHQAWYARHNQFGLFRIRVAASDTTTAGEVRVINVGTGVGLGPFLSPAWTGVRAAGSTAYTEIVSPGLNLPGTMHTSISVAVQVRRTAGTGTLTVAVPESRGSTP